MPEYAIFDKVDFFIKLVLQLGVNSGNIGFKRSDAFEMLEPSLPANMTKAQKLNHVSNIIRSLQTSGLLCKIENGRAWVITDKGRQEI